MSWIIQGTECYKQQLSLSPCWMQINWFHILRSTSSFGFGGLHGTHLSKLYRKLAICWWWHPSWSISRRRGRLFSYSFVLVTFCGGFFCWRLCSLFILLLLLFSSIFFVHVGFFGCCVIVRCVPSDAYWLNMIICFKF